MQSCNNYYSSNQDLTYSVSRASAELGVVAVHHTKDSSIGGVISNNPCLDEKSSKHLPIISNQGYCMWYIQNLK